MLKQTENSVKIEGILSEIDLDYGSFVKNGATVESIGGTIKVQVTQKINGEDAILEVPVHMFASKLTNKGTPNPAYESIEKIKTSYVSIAAGGIDAADRVRITGGITIRMVNLFLSLVLVLLSVIVLRRKSALLKPLLLFSL